MFVCFFPVSHHGNILSSLFQLVFDAASDVSEVRQGELFKLSGSQDPSVGLKHLQSLNTHTHTHTAEEVRETCLCEADCVNPGEYFSQ